MPSRIADASARRPYIILGANNASSAILKPGASYTLSTTYTEVVNVANSAGFIVRIKSAVAGSLALAWPGPDFIINENNQSTTPGGGATYSFGTIVTAAHTFNPPTGSPLAVSANTETGLVVAAGGAGGYNGEDYVLIQWTPTTTGILNYITIGQLQRKM